MFQHYIVTRFNLKSNDTALTSAESDEWMKERFKIFQDFCYPSVMHQKNKNFFWLVFFDMGTGEEYKKIINQLSKQSDIFIPIYVSSTLDFIPKLKLEIQSRLTTTHIITSRLDNDDCLHQDYVDTVQNNFHQQRYLAINFINGLTLKISGEMMCGYRIHANNPFISLIESTEAGFETVYCKHHGAWGKIKLIKQVNNDIPLWITVTHKNNLLNRYIGFGHVQPNLLKDFNINRLVLENITPDLKPNSPARSFINRFSAYTHCYLKIVRNKIRGTLNLIPQR